MRDIGQKLRDARMAAGLSLQDIADHTRIRVPYLEAMEEGQFEKLPGAVYVKGFIKQYAQTVGIDATELIEMYRQESQEEPSQAVSKVAAGSVEEPRKRMDRRRQKAPRFNPRKVAIFTIILLILGGVAYFSYFMFTTLKNETIPQLRDPEVVDEAEDIADETDVTETGDSITEETDLTGADTTGTDTGVDTTAGVDTTQQTTDPATQDSDSYVTDQTGTPGQTTPNQTTPGQSSTDHTVTEQTTSGQQTPGQTGPQGQTGTTTPPANTTGQNVNPLTPESGNTTPAGTTTPSSDNTITGATTQIQLVVTGTSWIRVDVDGKNALTQTVQNQTLNFSGQKITVKVGNGGAVQVMQNGVLSEPFGKSGSVVTREFGQ